MTNVKNMTNLAACNIFFPSSTSQILLIFVIVSLGYCFVITLLQSNLITFPSLEYTTCCRSIQEVAEGRKCHCLSENKAKHGKYNHQIPQSTHQW